MSAYNTILIALDIHGSPEQLLAKAAAIVGNQASTIHALSVSPDPAYLYPNFPAFAPNLANFDWATHRKDMLARLSNLTEQAGLSQANIISETGRTTHVILEQAQELGADLIVVGSHGRQGLGRLLGSTANGVLHRANCDVLVVRMADNEAAAE